MTGKTAYGGTDRRRAEEPMGIGVQELRRKPGIMDATYYSGGEIFRVGSGI
jgi:hypothetical protein